MSSRTLTQRIQRLKARLTDSELARQTVAYGLMKLLTMAPPVLVGPILTHHLEPRDYGIASLFLAAYMFLAPAAGLGVQTGIRRRYYDPNEYHLPTYVWSCTVFTMLQSVAVTLLLAASYPLWGTSDVSWMWVFTFLPWIAGRYTLSVATTLLQLMKRPFSFGALNATQNTSYVIVSLILIIGMGFGWEGRVLGQVFGNVLVGVIAAVINTRLLERPRGVNFSYIKDALKIGAPVLPYALVDRALRFGDRVLLAAMTTIDEVGLYMLAVQVSNIAEQATAAFALAWQPWLFERLAENTERSKRRVVIGMYLGGIGMLLMGIGLWIGVKWVYPLVIGDKYQRSVVFLPWLCVGNAMRGFANLLSHIIVFAEKTTVLTRIASVMGVVNLGGAAVLVYSFGTEGAAYAAFGGFALNLIAVWLAARKIMPMRGF